MTLTIIFDMNGVIVDDEPIQQRAWLEYGKRHNISITEQELRARMGRTAKENFRSLYNREISDSEYEKFSNERLDIAIELFKKNPKLVNGVKNLLDDLLSNDIPMAVATSARKRYLDFILDDFELRKYFTTVITGEDVTKGKPNPEVFLKAAKGLNAESRSCIVVEDTPNGIKAGKAANMKVVAITTTFAPKELSGVGADLVIKDFNELSVDRLRTLTRDKSTVR